MRAKNREINIFNIALLDILSGALGAFLFLMLALVPFYDSAGNESEQLEEARQKQREAEEKQKEAEQFLVVGLFWFSSAPDVDFWLRFPSGSWFGPKPQMGRTKNSGEASGDAKSQGTQREVQWLTPPVLPGAYWICYRIGPEVPASGLPFEINGWYTFRTSNQGKLNLWSNPIWRTQVRDTGRTRLLAVLTIKDTPAVALDLASDMSAAEVAAIEKQIARDEGVAYVDPAAVVPAPASAEPDPKLDEQRRRLLEDLRRRQQPSTS